ncbi:MAG: sigma factor-like helix-turn-helix DNA-binding protein, partial [Gemmiger sp.]
RLRRYQDSLRQEKRLREAICRERARLESTGCALGGLPRGGGRTDRLGDGIAVLLARQQELTAQLAASEQLRREIEAAINALNAPLQREALLGRYVDGLEWWKVADRLFISERHARRLHSAALERLKTGPSMSALGKVQ